MEVSRMTLRKALALLQEDGLIKNVRGKGNFILEPSIDTVTTGKSILHPVHHYCTETSDSVELDFRIEPPTKAISQSLKRQTPAVVIVDRWYKLKNIPYAYSLSFLPIELIGDEHLDFKSSRFAFRIFRRRNLPEVLRLPMDLFAFYCWKFYCHKIHPIFS